MARRQERFTKKTLAVVAVLAFVVGAGTSIAVQRIVGCLASGGRIWAVENVQSASVNIVAVRSDGPGIVASLDIRITRGDGRILIDTHPLVGFDFQEAAQTAVQVAATSAGYALDDDGIGIKGADVLFTVSAQGSGQIQIQAIDGPSAGAVTTIATLAALENKRVKTGVIMTGTVQANGSIGQVGGVFAKAQAAENVGAQLFLVPSGQSVVMVYKEVTQQVGHFQWVTYQPVQVDLEAYAENNGWAMQIQEVSTIDAAASLMLE